MSNNNTRNNNAVNNNARNNNAVNNSRNNAVNNNARNNNIVVNNNNVVNNNSRNNIPDNRYENCPALMSDGRFITNYKPNCEMNRNIERSFQQNVPLSSWEYKYNLINKSNEVFGNMDKFYNDNFGCSGYPYKILEPELKQDCNYDNCVLNNNNSNGLGVY